MKYIIDTNILISGLIKDSTTRKILFNKKLQFYLPEYVLVEVNKYIPEIAKKSSLTVKNIENLLNLILEHLNIVPFNEYKKNLERAIKIFGHIDEKDVQFIALALSINNDGIWTNDKHFTKQDIIKVITTEDMINSL